MPNDQQLSTQDLKDLAEIRSHMAPDDPRVGKILRLVQQHNAQPTQFEKQQASGEFMGGAPREAALGLFGQFAPEAVNSVQKMIEGMVQKPALKNYMNPIEGVADNLYAMGASAIKGAGELGGGVLDQDWKRASHGLGTLAGSAIQALGFREAGGEPPRLTTERPPVVPSRAALPVTEIPGSEVQRATPISSTGKTATATTPPVTTPTTPGVSTKGSSFGSVMVSEVPGATHTPDEIMGNVGIPEMRKTPTLPEVKAEREIAVTQAARRVTAKPNPVAGPEPPVTVQVAPTTARMPRTATVEPRNVIDTGPGTPPTPSQRKADLPAIDKPEYPGPEATLDQLKDYAQKRDIWQAQQAAKPGAKVTNKPADILTIPGNDIAQGIKRIVKASDQADLERRFNEHNLRLQNLQLSPEDGVQMAKALRDKSVALTTQAAELERNAAAPAKIAEMAEQKGGSLFGQWERSAVSPEERAAAIAAGEEVPRSVNFDLSGKSAGERDMYHELLGHGTTEVLTRDAKGQPVNVNLKAEGVKEFVEAKRAELAKIYDNIKASEGIASPELLEHAANLKDIIEETTGLRDRLAVSDPRKGLPVTDEAGVVRTPGAIPDIGQKSSNALTGKPIGGHTKVASPEKLLDRATTLRTAADLYEKSATYLEKKYAEGNSEPKVEPVVKPVAQVMKEAVPTPKPPDVKPIPPDVAQTALDNVARRQAAQGEIQRQVRENATTLANADAGEIARLQKAYKAATGKEEKARLRDTISAYQKAAAPAEVSPKMEETAQRLFATTFRELTEQNQLKVLSSVAGYEAKMPRTPFENKPAAANYEAPYHQGFPPGDVPPEIREKVDSLHTQAQEKWAQATKRLQVAVVNQHLATREAAYRLYGRAVGTLMLKDSPEGLKAALDIANRRGEAGFLNLQPLVHAVQGIRDRLTPGVNPSPKEVMEGTRRYAKGQEYQKLASIDRQMEAGRKFFDKMSDNVVGVIADSAMMRDATAYRWYQKPFMDLGLDEKRAIAGFQFMKDIQSGDWKTKYAGVSPLYNRAMLARTLLDESRVAIQNVKPSALRTFYENYFPQRWEGINNLAEYRDKVYGAKAAPTKSNFLKEKYHQSLQAGEDAGLRPLETNPMMAVRNQLAEAAHFIAGQEQLNAMSANGWLKTFKSPRYVPRDWSLLDSKIAGPGKYAPSELATMYNKQFDSGLFGMQGGYKGIAGQGLDSVRILNQAIVQANISMSAFHVWNTGMEALASDISLIGLRSLDLAAHPLSPAKYGKLASETVKSIPLVNYFMGRVGYNKWLNVGRPGNPVSDVMKGYMEGGNRPGTSKSLDFKTPLGQVWRDMRKAVDANEYYTATNQALRLIPSMMRAINSPIMDNWVRFTKMGTTLKNVAYKLDELGPGATEAERRAAMREVADSMDNRFGQMNEDNLGWSAKTRDAVSLGFKFAEYSYGTIREGFGAVKDIPRAAVGGGVSLRLAHAFGLATAWGLVGGVAYELMNHGERPQTAEDLFAPWNGRYDADGKKQRLLVHGYERNYFDLAKMTGTAFKGDFPGATHMAGDYAFSRMSPVLNTLHMFYNNRDFMGNPLRDPNDPTMQQFGTMMSAILRQGTPISLSQAERVEQQGGKTRDKVLNYIGLQPAPRSMHLDQTPAEVELQNQLRMTHGEGYASAETIAREKAMNRVLVSIRNKDGNAPAIIQDEMAKGHLHRLPDVEGKSDVTKIMDRLEKPFMQRVNELKLPGAVSVLEKVTTPGEYAIAREAVSHKLRELGNEPDEAKRNRLWQRAVKAGQRVLPAETPRPTASR